MIPQTVVVVAPVGMLGLPEQEHPWPFLDDPAEFYRCARVRGYASFQVLEEYLQEAENFQKYKKKCFYLPSD
ncbi:MAG: hypothetical protein AAF364_16705 [Pseudomonadota bacterium]